MRTSALALPVDDNTPADPNILEMLSADVWRKLKAVACVSGEYRVLPPNLINFSPAACSFLPRQFSIWLI